jgi:transcriptional regulator with XRE-family HTH domain
VFIPALPFCHAELRAPKPKPSAYPKQINTLGDHIRTRRLDLNLLQREVGDRIGVDALTITNWESNATNPAIRYIPAIIQFLGDDPFPPAKTFTERLFAARKSLGLSQRKMAGKLAVDPATLQGWECGAHRPSPKSLESISRIPGLKVRS